MNWMEIALLILGVGAFTASFVLPEKKKKGEDMPQFDQKKAAELIEQEVEKVKGKVVDVVDETLEYAVEKTERAVERISNEKIMAVSEYADTVLADMNKAHQEVMFLYDMLNDKHENLKETVKKADKQAKEVEEKAKEAEIKVKAAAEQKEKPVIVPEKKETVNHITLDMLTPANNRKEFVKLPVDSLPDVSKKKEAVSAALPSQPVKVQKTEPVVEVYSFAEQAPRVERTVKKDIQAVQMENAVAGIQKEKKQTMSHQEPKKNHMNIQFTPGNDAKENNNERILTLHKEGKSNVAIAKELGLGVGEVKLVINLFKGA